MALVLTSGPAVEPVTLAEAKAHLRVDGSAEDRLIASLILTSRLHIEAALGLALITQSWRLLLDRWPEPARGADAAAADPERSTAVMCSRRRHAGRSIAATAISLDGTACRRASCGTGASWPASGRVANGIEIDFTAGYGDAAERRAGTDPPGAADARRALVRAPRADRDRRRRARHSGGRVRAARALPGGAPMSEISIGALSLRFALQAPIRTDDGGGGASVTWSARCGSVGRAAAGIGRRGRRGGRCSRAAHARDLDPAPRGDRGRDAVRARPACFDIRAVIAHGWRRRFLKCLVEERVP